MCFSSLLLLKTENAFDGKRGAEDISVRDGAGRLPAEVVTKGAGSEKPEVRQFLGNPCKNAAAVMNGKTAVRVSVNKFFSVAEDTDFHEAEDVVFRPEERKDLAEKRELLPSVAYIVTAYLTLSLFVAEVFALFFCQSGGVSLWLHADNSRLTGS